MLTSVYFSPASNVNEVRQVIGQNNELLQFLADRTNGRAYATVLRPSVCRRL